MTSYYLNLLEMLVAPESVQVTRLNVRKKLRTLLRNPSKSLSHLHIYGPFENGVGESVRATLNDIEFNKTSEGSKCIFLRVNCSYIDGSPRILLNALKEEMERCHINLSDKKIDSISDLCEAFDTECNYLNHRIYIILEDSDSLMKLPHHTLSGLFAVSKTVKSFLRIITVGELSWVHMSAIEVISKPVSLYIAAMTREECISLIKKSLPDTPERFTVLVLEAAYLHCRDFNKLLQMVRSAWDRYRNTGHTENFHHKHAREIIQDVTRDNVLCRLSGQNETFDLPLPTSAKYLMIAAYCAGNNAPTSDRRFFTKHHGREQRSDVKEKAASLSADLKEAGPKIFDLQRLTFIYKSLLSLYPVSDLQLGDLNCQVSSLVAMGLLSRASSSANLDHPKFKCLLSYENARSIARSLSDGFNLDDHLEKR